jgi:cytosine/adenosine deaminase-related metal-dependent hydrolase
MQAAGLRAYVGKLSMDIDISSPQDHSDEAATPNTYIEPSADESLKSAKSFIKRCQKLTAHLPPSQRLVEPVLTPRFTPTCSDELLTGLGEISADQSVKIQSHLAEAKDQVEWVRAERGMEDIDVFRTVSQLLNLTDGLLLLIVFHLEQSPNVSNNPGSLHFPFRFSALTPVFQGDINCPLSSFQFLFFCCTFPTP